ncbi:MAG: zinc dependent phospholipase C family protein [Chloroflexi bacterium]|nr:zinc dependent phospholipase C family protein [Chloroflexota bacterium]
MPTPFYHLSIAYELLEHPDLPKNIRSHLTSCKNTFLYGKTAPDVQVVSGQRREATHFYTLPPEDKTPAWKRLMAAYPTLADASALPEEMAAFLAGYICHLQADETWIFDLFLPIFGPDADWADFRERLYLHNVLRIYLDKQVLNTLPTETSTHLQATIPNSWLPFVEDNHLSAWRDYLADQLLPGAAVQTIEVFANRQGLAPEEFSNILNSEELMEEEIFTHVSRQRLGEFHQNLLAKNLQLLQTYLP